MGNRALDEAGVRAGQGRAEQYTALGGRSCRGRHTKGARGCWQAQEWELGVGRKHARS
jgi:hypothetical protein